MKIRLRKRYGFDDAEFILLFAFVLIFLVFLVIVITCPFIILRIAAAIGCIFTIYIACDLFLYFEVIE